MKKIILIDDNSHDQRLIYGASFVDNDEYADVLIHLEQLNKDFDMSILAGCECVLIHDSLEDYIDGRFNQYSHEAKDIIGEYLDNNNTPYVSFSDGHQSTGEYDNDNNIVRLKKSDFYNRLKYFLDQYRAQGVAEFKILAYGRNFRKEMMIGYVKGLFRRLGSKRPKEILKSKDVMPEKTDSEKKGSEKTEVNYLAEIIDLAGPALGLDYDEMLNYIEDEEITVDEFRRKINKILDSISQNGKNSYTWE